MSNLDKELKTLRSGYLEAIEREFRRDYMEEIAMLYHRFEKRFENIEKDIDRLLGR